MTGHDPTSARKRGPMVLGAVFTALVSTMIVVAPAAKAETIEEVLNSRGDLSTFTNALKQSHLWDRLSSYAPLILFVPSNTALEANGSAFLLEQVLITQPNKQLLWDSMALHIAPQQVMPAEMESYSEKNTLAALCISIEVVDGRIRVGPEASLIERISTDDGSVYVLDRLLWRSWEGGDHCNGPVVSQALPGDTQQSR